MSLILRVITRVLAFCLLAEALLSATRLVGLLSVLAAYDGVALLLIVLRAALAPLQFAGGWFLATNRPQGPPLARAALVAGTVLTVFDVGLALAPLPVYYWLRWQATGLYALYALVGLVVLSIRDDERAQPA